ncbi:MAG TPA: DUF1553 domain-containing protein [bacterium]|nr:DUF1553 domain-containing protein [bacterium]
MGPIAADSFDDARERRFAPEIDGVRLDQEQAGRRWRRRDDFVDGRVHNWRGDNSAFYLHRVVTVERDGNVTLSLGSDDAIAVWWNGRSVLRKNVARAARPDQDRVVVDAVAGDNELLLKITNGGGPGGFCFELWGAAEAGLRQRVRELERELDAHRGPAVPIMRELPAAKRRTTHVHVRGSFLDQGEVVHADTPKVWPPFPDGFPRNRLGLAKWLMAADNPLTARVLANRIWSELFGRGIVTTLEDFGTQGEPPSHPHLLDWLACEFVDGGWSLRHLLRTIVLSATYGQSSRLTDAHLRQDPDNVWLARGAAFRLSAEQLRDQALAVSGLLHVQLGGPSVMPPQPEGVWMQIYSGEKWRDAEGPDRYRRALYTFWRRTSPHPAMLLFDAQSREACVLRRSRSNTPLQALVLWNDPQFLEPARALGELASDRGGRDPARGIAWMWRRCLLREPTPTEVARLLDLFDDERARGLSATYAWSLVASVVLCLDEFVTRR